ncbi:MAG: GGDEF domain-containing protein [Lachnospiraceae bacterium]|nr:diguanylate cyclase (GGDEF) domain-containing protein [Lachnospiraceae bacterium 28-4]MCI8845682.1 GGDEF domain-containing protein [Lachnospiraceae bacterium]
MNTVCKELSNDEKMFQMIYDMSDSAFLYYNFGEKTVKTVGSWNKFFDTGLRTSEELKKIGHCVEEEYAPQFEEFLFPEKKGIRKGDMTVRLRDGKTWLECEAVVIYDKKGRPKDKVLRFEDITKFKRQHEELIYLAYYDMLTGLYNRNYFVQLLGKFLRKAEKEEKKVGVMFVDIDDFHRINDGLGIVVGDEVVQQYGQYLSSFGGKDVIVSHFNSDIYCLAIYDSHGTEEVEQIYRAMGKRLEKPFILSGGQEIFITAGIGVASYPEAAKNALELINCAEIVMLKGKARGKGSIQYFDTAILKDFLQDIDIENKLKDAVFHQNFTIAFQPQYQANNKKLRGVEALIRWKDKEGNMISPSVFIPIAEKNGTIISIGSWVMEESVRIFSGWKKKYQASLILALNISAIQYKRRDFVDSLMQVLEKYEVSPSEVELEITESILIDDLEEVKNKLLALKEYGFKISLDDFGTGYSSLSYLKGLPIDTLKIDKSFIDTVISDNNTKIITESIIYMVKRLGYETVAEGVETKEQFEYLKSIECDSIQGYFLGRPMPPDQVEMLLNETAG